MITRDVICAGIGWSLKALRIPRAGFGIAVSGQTSIIRGVK